MYFRKNPADFGIAGFMELTVTTGRNCAIIMLLFKEKFMDFSDKKNRNPLAERFVKINLFFIAAVLIIMLAVRAYIPAFIVIVIAFVFYIIGSSLLLKRQVFTPLQNLTASVSETGHGIDSIYGIERDD